MTTITETQAGAPFHLMAKPSGPACNLDCSYCFYLDREALFDTKGTRRMSADVLDAYVRQTIAAAPAEAPVEFTWQGGEPTLLGIDFYARAVDLQRRYGAGRTITNSFQTNGTLIDDDWAAFLAEHGFLVGLSLDGPDFVHDRWRRYANGKPTHALVMAALRRLQSHGVQYNVLACVDAHSGDRDSRCAGRACRRISRRARRPSDRQPLSPSTARRHRRSCRAKYPHPGPSRPARAGASWNRSSGSPQVRVSQPKPIRNSRWPPALLADCYSAISKARSQPAALSS
jgi:sulfatase maturation enzyme AslB (radical SAM superfamily)